MEVAAAAFGLSWAGVELIRRWAAHLRLLDVPNRRSSHTRPTPRGGGLAIVLIVCGGFGVYLVTGDAWRPELLGFLFAQLLVAGVGLTDDLVSLSSRSRLVVHVAAAAVLLLTAGPSATDPSQPGGVWFNRLAIPLSMIWLVGLTNAYNFMDGIDGIAGGQAVLAGVGWAVVGWMTREPLIALVGVLVASASAGFLVHNWPPGRVFMGDVGSGFLGFTFGALAVIGARREWVLALCGPLLVWPFVFDASLTMARRLLRGENVLQAHRSHLYQRLVIVGVAHRDVTVLYLALAGSGMAAAVALSAHLPGAGIAAAIGIPSLALVLWRHVRSAERPARPDPASTVVP